MVITPNLSSPCYAAGHKKLFICLEFYSTRLDYAVLYLCDHIYTRRGYRYTLMCGAVCATMAFLFRDKVIMSRVLLYLDRHHRSAIVGVAYW